MISSREKTTLPNPARTFWGILAAAVFFLVAMSIAALIAVQLGIIGRPEERIDLGPWLMFEIIVGSAIGLAVGAFCRRFTASSRATWILAAVMLLPALLEAAEIARHASTSAVIAPRWLVWSAPVLLPLAISLGGWVAGSARKG
jgi:hypothetical protein